MDGMLFLRKNPLETAGLICLFILGCIGLPDRRVGELFTSDPLAGELMGMFVCRMAAAVLMLFFSIHLGLFCRVGTAPSFRALPYVIPAAVVAVNNAPIIALAGGEVSVTAGWEIAVLFLAQCFAVSLFEELSFRAIVFPLLLQKFGAHVRGRFFAVILSSALFGAMHLVGIFSGVFAGAALLQASYSFLIGAMLCIVLLYTGSIWPCVLIHTCGQLVPTLGSGSLCAIWNIPTVVITAMLAVAVIVFYCVILIYAPWEKARQLYRFTAKQKFLIGLKGN